MKRLPTLIILILAIFVSGAFSQIPDESKRKDRPFETKTMQRTQVFSKVYQFVNTSVENDKLLWFIGQYQDFAKSEEWINGYRVSYTYDNDRIVQITHEWYDIFEDEWMSYSLGTISYTNGMPSEMIWMFYDPDLDEMVNAYRDVTEYIMLNGTPHISEFRFYNWDDQEDEWAPEFKVNPEYVNNELDMIHSYSHDGDDWVYEDRSTFTQVGNNVVEVWEEWDGNAFGNYERITYLDILRADIYAALTAGMNAIDMGTDLIEFFLFQEPDQIYDYWDGENWVQTYRVTYRTYDNRLLNTNSDYLNVFLVEDYYSGFWSDHYKVEMPVLNGKLHMATAYFSDGEFMTPDMREEFLYDADGFMAYIYSGFSDGNDGFFYDHRVMMHWDGMSVNLPGTPEIPQKITLGNAYPNPFNPVTNVPFELSGTGHVNISVFDITGRKVGVLLNDTMQAGRHTISFNANGLASGIYHIRLETGGEVKTGKVSLVK